MPRTPTLAGLPVEPSPRTPTLAGLPAEPPPRTPTLAGLPVPDTTGAPPWTRAGAPSAELAAAQPPAPAGAPSEAFPATPSRAERPSPFAAAADDEPHTSPEARAPAPESRPARPSTVPGDPTADFVGWMKRVAAATDPAAELRRLDTHRDEPLLRDAARMYVRMLSRRAARQPEAVPELVLALGAAAHLRLTEVRDTLRESCIRARERLEHSGGLPEAEEHFALAALRCIEGRTGGFDLNAVYDEYESMLAQSTSVLETAGDAAAAQVVESFAALYRDQLDAVLGIAPSRPAATSEDDEWARRRAAANRAATPAPSEDDEWTQRRAAANRAATPAPSEDDEWARRRAEANRVATPAPSADDEWARRRAAATPAPSEDD
jgi:hypothetical protein